MKAIHAFIAVLALGLPIFLASTTFSRDRGGEGPHGRPATPGGGEPRRMPRAGGEFDERIAANAAEMMEDGRRIFRYDTFGDEAFWGGTLQLHKAVATLGPRAAIALGLKVDLDALPGDLVSRLKRGLINLDDPAVTLALLRTNAVLGVTGRFGPGGELRSMGIQCALCHSTVDNALAPGIGHRLDGWANRDLNVGAIVASAPNLTPLASLLGADTTTVKAVLNSWGPGKFDAELLLDGKAVGPNGPGATLIPNAYGLAGYNQHTWTGGWGTVSYWNALVANIEMGGIGRFYDPRLNDPTRFPIAAKAGFGDIRRDPDDDQITSKLPALHFYQMAIPAPKPRPGIDFNPAAAALGDALFEDKARCNTCHVEPLWTEPGWNEHTAQELVIDDFQANRSPDRTYKTMNLAGLFVRERGLFMFPENAGRYYHDGRFKTLLDVVESYNARFHLGLTPAESAALVEYLKSL